MRESSAAFARAVAASHQMISRVDVLFDRAVIAEGLNVTDGSVTFDRRASRRSRCQVQIADPARVPVAADDILTPFGYEMLIWRGVVLDGTPELVPLGVFPIQQSFVDGVSLLSDITALDRSQLVSDARFEDVYQISAGTNYATAIEALVADGVSGLEYLFPSTTFTTPLLTFAAQDDRWDAAVKMASAIGMELFFDGLGRLTMQPEPTFTATQVARIAETENMVSAAVKLDRTPAYNKVIATSNNASTGDQYRGEAADMDPNSPTFYDGPFGRKPRFYASEFIASDAQAASAAAAILAGNLGVARSIDFSAVPDPRLEVSDVVHIFRSRLEIDELHIIDELTIGLGPGDPMLGRSRTNQSLETS